MLSSLSLHSLEKRAPRHSVAMRLFWVNPNPGHPLLTSDPKASFRFKLSARISFDETADAHFLSRWVEKNGDPLECQTGQELWKRTCFEIFMPLSGSRYLEIHLSADRLFACYELAEYRAPLVPVEEARALAYWKKPEEKQDVLLNAVIEIPRRLFATEAFGGQVGLSAVVEPNWLVQAFKKTVNQTIDPAGEQPPFLWALLHSSDRPDFHNSKDWVGSIVSSEAHSERDSF